MQRTLRDCIVLAGPELAPHRCARLVIDGDTIAELDILEPVMQLDDGALVVMPGMYNSHTHMGDSFLPDGATGLTLEEGFFRPHGMKYRELAKLKREDHLRCLCETLGYMARTGTIGHLDFREQGPYGVELLREAAEQTGIDSVILGQFDGVPFDEAALDKDTDPLPDAAKAELAALLDVADGFSESTMNDLTSPAWQEIRAMTEARQKLRAIHCLENEGYRDNSLRIAGVGDLQRALDLYHPHLIVHMTVANASEIALLAASGVPAVLNPRANANLGLPLPPVHALMKSGAALLLGTDNGLLNSPNLFAELDFTYKLAKSQAGDPKLPDPFAILRMVTSNIRQVLGEEHGGYLAAGMPASFVVLNFHQSHLKRSRHLGASILTRVTPEDVLATYRCGRPLYESASFADVWQQP
ncbi:MAG: amidohydrolase family protein [Halieaceae bacterium]|jgi:cytosine/adenosine deaminase-related metal-dependent hydrolase|nr:amidohydrolase family protein [Halieaceae bacterium]